MEWKSFAFKLFAFTKRFDAIPQLIFFLCSFIVVNHNVISGKLCFALNLFSTVFYAVWLADITTATSKKNVLEHKRNGNCFELQWRGNHSKTFWIWIVEKSTIANSFDSFVVYWPLNHGAKLQDFKSILIRLFSIISRQEFFLFFFFFSLHNIYMFMKPKHIVISVTEQFPFSFSVFRFRLLKIYTRNEDMFWQSIPRIFEIEFSTLCNRKKKYHPVEKLKNRE